jgi:hypothetical protein
MNAPKADFDSGQQQIETWDLLYHWICQYVRRLGTEGVLETDDCWVHDDNWGSKQQKIYIRNLGLLKPTIIKSLQLMLKEFPDWEIRVAVAVPGAGRAWPDMGLTIRAHEIIDGLQRQYFPPEYRDIRYEGSRRGTDRD